MDSSVLKTISPRGLILAVVSVVIITWLTSVVKWRLSYRKMSGSLKSPPFSFLFGSIPGIASLYSTSPMDTHPHNTMCMLQRKYNLEGLYFLDNWPFTSDIAMMICDPELAAQAAQTTQYSLPKYHVVKSFIGHLAGKTSMISAEGAEWKRIRSLFNPGFAISHLMTLVPVIVDDTLIYVRKLETLAKSGKVEPLEDVVARLTIDIMGSVVLDHPLNSQTGDNELVDAFRAAVTWTPEATKSNPFLSFNPVRTYMQGIYAARMDKYIKEVIQQRIAKRQAQENSSAPKSRRRPAIDFAVDQYLESKGGVKTAGVDEEFQQMCIDQMKSFLFAGHDTSSSTLCFIYHLLNTHPEAMAKIRKEHEEVFGNGDVESVGEKVKTEANLLNSLPYTTAVIKETLRLFPPASSARQGVPGFNLVYKGKNYPTDGKMVWLNSCAIHRRADLFPCPDEFIPERFLFSPEIYPAQASVGGIIKDAWRPFEKGPRACIGQELAMLEMKIILVMSCKWFDIKAEYEVWDRKLGRAEPGGTLGGRRGLWGDRAYQEMKVTAKPSDGMPVRVTRRDV